MMDEELRTQIEQLRANRARRRMEVDETEEERPRRRRHNPDDFDEGSKPERRDDGILGVLTFQSILAVALAIAYVLLMTFSPTTAGEAFRLVKDKAEHDFSFKNQVYDSVGALMTFLNELQPVQVNAPEGLSSDGGTTSDRGDADVGDHPSSDVISSEDNSSSVPDSSEPTASGTTASEAASTGAEAGQGGEFNPVQGQTLPANATFAPVVYTGRISFPIAGGGRITSNFGFRDHPTNGEAEFHTAVDIAAAKGTNVLAAADGTVVTSEETAGLGRHIVVDHGHDFYTVYGHCDRLLVKAGTRVREGEVIAKVGSTGDSTGYHLHFGMKKDGLYFNPAYIFPQFISEEEE